MTPKHKQPRQSIPIFIPHIGCPHRCSFCNQIKISGHSHAPTPEEVRSIVEQSLPTLRSPQDTEIAFFGGSFTAIPRDYLCALLESVQKYLQRDGLLGIRISTRPDAIDPDTLRLLCDYHVTSIELGCQSLDDHVLLANQRGHTANDIYKAVMQIRDYPLSLGLQMMTGLYQSTCETDRTTAEKIVALHPDFVRIYPTVILKDTPLATWYREGRYSLPDWNSMLDLIAELLLLFARENIPVIRCGLHASDGVEGEQLAGYYHPALRELCEGRIYRHVIEQALPPYPSAPLCVRVAPRCLSRAIGQRQCNRNYFAKKGYILTFQEDPSVPLFACHIEP